MSDLPPLTVLYEDNHCLAVSKPGGLLTQGVPPGVPTLEGQVKDYLRVKYAKAGNVYLGIPHRLDRPVSGVILFARSSKAAARLAEQFANRTVEKVYWACWKRTRPASFRRRTAGGRTGCSRWRRRPAPTV
ncbi:MAG: pseudouridine synthase [Gemmataceae bacterium]